MAICKHCGARERHHGPGGACPGKRSSFFMPAEDKLEKPDGESPAIRSIFETADKFGVTIDDTGEMRETEASPPTEAMIDAMAKVLYEWNIEVLARNSKLPFEKSAMDTYHEQIKPVKDDFKKLAERFYSVLNGPGSADRRAEPRGVVLLTDNQMQTVMDRFEAVSGVYHEMSRGQDRLRAERMD